MYFMVWPKQIVIPILDMPKEALDKLYEKIPKVGPLLARSDSVAVLLRLVLVSQGILRVHVVEAKKLPTNSGTLL